MLFEKAKFILETMKTHLLHHLHIQICKKRLMIPFWLFIRLVGCAYFKKHTSAFPGETPECFLNSFSSATTPLDQHKQWLEQAIWDRISFENEMISSLEAFTYHWLRSCWILHLWQQALCNHTQLAPLHGHGWMRDKGGNRDIYWDTEENRYKVKSRVDLLMKGCSCKSGCGTNRCGCRKSGEACGPGCRCVNCIKVNTEKEWWRDKTLKKVNGHAQSNIPS